MQSGGATSGETYERVVDGASVMLYDPRLVSNLTQAWFEPAHWQAEGALHSVARGRGNTWFVMAPPAAAVNNVGSKIWVLRHYRRGGAMAALMADRYWYRGWEHSRPWREFMLLQAMWREALPVPRVIAARITRTGPWYRGDLVTEAIEGSVTFASCLAAGEIDSSLWFELGLLVARFHAAGACHADLNAHNVLLAENRLWLIDFDRGQRRKPGLWCDSVLVRLRRSLLKIRDGSPNARFDENEWSQVLRGYRQGLELAGSS